MGILKNPLNWLLNRELPGAAVSAPAFSLTKVMSTTALVLTPLTTVLVKAFTKITFSSGEVVALTVGVLGLLALTSAADVIARSVATLGSTHQQVSSIDPISAQYVHGRAEDPVSIVAVRGSGDGVSFLTIDAASKLRWLTRGDLTFAAAP